MNEFTIKPGDIFEVIRRQRFAILYSFVSAFAFFVLLFLVLPRSYQSEVVLHIGVNYFQNPLIGDLVSQTHDPGELRSEREKIIKASLGVDFANRMGEKFHLFKTSPNDPARSVEVELFLKSLDISAVTSTQFRIKYKGRKAEVVDGVIKGALDSIRKYMYANRIQILEEFFGVLQDEISNSAQGGDRPRSASNSIGGRSAQTDEERTQMSSQIQLLEKRLSDLQRAYNEQHPSVQALKVQISELRALQKGGPLSPSLTRRSIFRSSTNSHNSAGEYMIKDDLSKQKHLVNISLEMERKDPTMSNYLSLVKEPVYPKNPIFPKLRLFLLFGLVGGVMASTIVAAIIEFWHRTEMPPKDVADALDLDFFGPIVLVDRKAGQ